MLHAEVLVTNGTGWKSRTREFNPSVSFIKILILKNFHEMFGLKPLVEDSLQLAAGNLQFAHGHVEMRGGFC